MVAKCQICVWASNYFSSDSARWGHVDTRRHDHTPAGELELIQNNGETVRCALILMSEWREKLAIYL